MHLRLLKTGGKILRVKRTKPYDAVVFIYDELISEVDYSKWSEYLIDIANDFISKDARVLELAAGNCKMASELIKTYPYLIVTDYSLPMLTYNHNLKFQKVCCDMTLLPFKIKFDLIYSTFDSINYILSKKKLFGLFTEVKRVLKDSGIFTFDVSLEKNSLEFEKSYETEGMFNGYHFIRKSKYKRSNRIHKNIFKIVDKNGNIFHEIHKQKIYKFNTYFELINKAGLYVLECLDAFTFNNGNANSERVQFVVETNKNKC